MLNNDQNKCLLTDDTDSKLENSVEQSARLDLKEHNTGISHTAEAQLGFSADGMSLQTVNPKVVSICL